MNDKVIKANLRIEFKAAQKRFDKKYRYLKRQFHKNELNALEINAKNNPTAMWATLNKLKDPPNIKTALEVVNEDGSISHNTKDVLNRWFKDISGLYSEVKDNPELNFNDEFYNKVVEKKEQFDRLVLDSGGDYSQELNNCEEMNYEIRYDEVSEAIDKNKDKKSHLEIPNEVLKNVQMKLLLYKFYNMCFKMGYNPVDWNFSDIIPIPKRGKDPRNPLENRCITIMCCVAKTYSNILNKRLQTFLEKNQLLVEEQNGFRLGRSCIDHIFVMCTVIRNRKMLGKETFLCFIDFKKAFDCVNRNLLLFKLSRIGIVGSMYRAISCLYSNRKLRVVHKIFKLTILIVM